MYHFVYRTHNIVNGKEYTGKHSTNNLEDGYYGSGKAIRAAVKKYGIENFAVEILSFHETEVEARLAELEIVDEEYVWRDDTYNKALGGDVGWYGLVSVKDKDGNTFQVSKYDERYLSGELVSVNKNMVNVKDKDGNTMRVSVNDPRYISGELVHIMNGTVLVKDDHNKLFRISVDDPRYLSGELKHATSGTSTFKDKNGNTMQTSINEPRVLSGELVGVMNGRKTGKHKSPAKNVICPYCGKEGKPSVMKMWHFEKCMKNPNRINDVSTCPYCGVSGRGNMTRYHFDNCKMR